MHLKVSEQCWPQVRPHEVCGLVFVLLSIQAVRMENSQRCESVREQEASKPPARHGRKPSDKREFLEAWTKGWERWGSEDETLIRGQTWRCADPYSDLKRTGPHRLGCLKAWSPGSGTIQRCGLAGVAVASLEECVIVAVAFEVSDDPARPSAALSLPAACQLGCRTLSSFSITKSAYVPLCLPPWR